MVGAHHGALVLAEPAGHHARRRAAGRHVAGNFNGLHISRAIAAENVGSALLSQGSASLDTASSGNLGGTLQFISRAPSDAFALDARETLGSDTEHRTYLRADTGQTGFGMFSLSYTDQDAEKWQGTGHQRQKRRTRR